MESKVIYIKAKRNVQVQSEDVFLKDIASLTCTDNTLLTKAKNLKIYKFQPEGEKRIVISSLKMIELIGQIEKNVTVESLGEQDILVRMTKPDSQKGFFVWVKVFFVSLISFFGTAFTIMAFHNDIGIHQVFSKIYIMMTGEPSDGFTILEVMYSLGLAVGIAVFFNHIGKRRITTDPTPIEAEMFLYERDVDDTLIETADREGKTIDVS